MGQNLNKIAEMYDTVATEYAEKFCGEHGKKPQDQEILYRFSQEVAGKKPVWDFGCGPGQTTQYLKNLGIEISGLDLSEKLIEQANMIHPDIIFRKGNILNLDFKNDLIAGIVEDFEVNQKLIVPFLEQYGHTVVMATNGKEALDRMSEQDFDLILMDIKMPVMDENGIWIRHYLISYLLSVFCIFRAGDPN